MKSNTLILLAAGLAVAASAASAAVTRYTDRNTFLASVRGNYYDSGTYATPTIIATNPISRSLNGWAVLADVANPGATPVLATTPQGLASNFSGPSLQFSAGGRPATAAGFTVFALAQNGSPVGETVTIATSGGESFDVSVPPEGLYVGFTTTVPFASITLNAAGGRFEVADFVTIGDAANYSGSDNCVGAVTVLTNSSTPFSNRFSGTDFGPWNIPGNVGFPASADVWMDWVATDTGTVAMDTVGSLYDTTLAVYRSTTCPTVGVVATAFNDDSNGTLLSRIVFPVVAGERYFVRLGGFGARRGEGVLNVGAITACDADFNSDGVVDFFDYLDFVQEFSGGC